MDEKLIEKFTEYLQRSEDFLIQEAPEIFKETLDYYYISSILGISISTLIFIFSLFVAIYLYLYPTFDKYELRDFKSTFIPIISCAIVVISFASICSNVDMLIKITYAPRYFLIKTFTKI